MRFIVLSSLDHILPAPPPKLKIPYPLHSSQQVQFTAPPDFVTTSSPSQSVITADKSSLVYSYETVLFYITG